MPSSAGACRSFPATRCRRTSTLLGLRENSNKASGVVWVRSTGTNQKGEMVLDYVRWVMVHKRDPQARRRRAGRAEDRAVRWCRPNLIVPAGSKLAAMTTSLAGSPHRWEDYEPGERIDHVSGITLEDSDHMFSTRLYQNTARSISTPLPARTRGFGRRLAYGGHVISLARALSFNGLANGFRMAAINAGSHVGPTFGGDTIYAWSEVLERRRCQAARISAPCECVSLQPRTALRDFPGKQADGKYHPAVTLDLDYWLLMPRR